MEKCFLRDLLSKSTPAATAAEMRKLHLSQILVLNEDLKNENDELESKHPLLSVHFHSIISGLSTHISRDD